MFFAYSLGIENCWGRIERIDSRVDTELSDATIERDSRVEMGKSICWSRICEVICWYIDCLNWCDWAIFRRSNPLLKCTHLCCKSWLVPYRRRDSSEERWDFWTCLSESEDIIDEEENISFFFIAEVLSHCETCESDSCTRPWSFIHLTEDHHSLVDDAWIFHFMVEVISFTSSFTDTCHDRVSSVFWCDIVDEFLHDDSFTDTCTSKETYFTTLEHRSDEIDNLDTCFKNFCLSREFIVSRRCFMNWSCFVCFWCWFFINWLAENIEHSAEYFWADRDRYRSF